MTAPLEGLKVLELARILAGPWAGQTLADLGADVIKVESPDGDDTRRWGPPFVSRGDGCRDAAYFHACNRGKRSISVDLRSPSGQSVVRRLAERSDVLIENFKVGGLASFGLDYQSLRELNSKLVYCSITGFGQSGPYAHRSGYDFLIQGMGGIMDLTGSPGGEPQKVGVAFADIFTGLYAVIAIQGALAEREHSGLGQFIDMALLDCQVAVLANQALNFLVSGNNPARLGNAHPNIVPYQVFESADGHLIVAVGNDRQFLQLCRVLSLEHIATDPRFRNNEARVGHREALIPALAGAIAGYRRDDLLQRLERVGVPAGPINTVTEVFADPQVVHRRLRLDIPDAGEGKTIPGVRVPICFSRNRLSPSRPAPRLGEHTTEILREIGMEGALG
ncbi:MAG: CoA transferase [Gammaproteobacteria bacterium]|nr:CoA transferase [Gammaproteobacteria bacterium]